MPRLFWRFFAVVWLTISATILTIIVISAFFGFLPPRQEKQQAREELVLDIAARMLASRGPEVTQVYLDEAGRQLASLDLKMEPMGSSSACSRNPGGRTRNVIYAGQCFHVAASGEEVATLLGYVLPPIMPWVAAVIASLGSAYLIARYLVGPIAKLRSGLSALAGGDFTVRIGQLSQGRKDEVIALAQDFDVTATRLQELQESQHRLFHDVSHELRSPLSRLQAAIGVLRKNTSRLDAMLPRLDREIELLDRLVEEILTLARLSSFSDKPLETQELDVIDLIGEIVEDARFEGSARQITVTYQGVESFVARPDGELIYRAVENVVRNAIKYTADGTTVAVSTRRGRDGNELEITVRDHGPSVSQDRLEVIFEPFVRANGDDVLPGHGLGLAITKRAVERHGGRVKAEQHPQGGLLVTLVVPRDQAH